MKDEISKGGIRADKALDPAECAERLRFETLLVDMSARFIHLPAGQVDDAIVDAQRRICECLKFDFAVLWQWEVGDSGVFKLTHHYQGAEGPLITRQLDGAKSVPWALREILAGRSVHISSVDDVPKGAERDAESWRRFGLKNALICPLSAGGGAPFGALSFHDRVAPRVWSEALVQRLKLVAQIFAGTLARKRSEQELRESEERLKLATEAAEAAPWVLDVQKACFWVGGQIREMFGLPPGDRLALEDFIRLVHSDDRPMICCLIEAPPQAQELAVVEYRIVRPDGQVRWMVTRGRACAPGEQETAEGRGTGNEGRKPTRLMGITADITARKQADEALARAHHQSQLILAAAAEGILGLDLAGDHVFVNPAAAEMLGYAPEELVGQGGHDIWHHSRADGAAYPDNECPICAVCRDGTEHHVVDEVFWRKDGTCFPVAYKCTPIQEAEQRVGAVITFEDVTGRRETERVLRESRARMAAALDVAELGFYEMLNNVRVTFLDRRAREIIGASEADEQAGRILEFWMEHLHPEDLPGVMEVRRLMEEAGRDRMTVDYRFLNPARGVIHIHHLAHVLERDAAGRAVRTIGVLQDATELKLKEEGLRAQQAHIASAIEVAGLGFYETGKDGRTHVANERLRELAGISAETDESQVQDHWLARIHPEDLPRVLQLIQDLRGGIVDRVAAEYRYRHSTRGELWFHQLSRVLDRDASGRAIRTAGVIQDITERKAAELEALRTQNELAHATRMSMLGELAASLAHELNQPLAAILSNAQAARRFLAAPDPDMREIREILDDIVRDDKRAGEVIHHMRAMVKNKGVVEAEPLDFSRLVRDTAKLVHSEMVGRNIGLELDLAPRLPAILAGRVEMQQVLLNLMVNAMDAMRDQPAERRLLRIQTSAVEGWVRVALRDHGHGLTEEMMADIFRPFFTTKTQGLGMGLSISRSMVEAHGGKLRAENAPDGGAIFWIEMPVGEEQEEKGAGGEGRGEEPRPEGRGTRGEGGRTAEGRGTRGEGNSRGEGA